MLGGSLWVKREAGQRLKHCISIGIGVGIGIGIGIGVGISTTWQKVQLLVSKCCQHYSALPTMQPCLCLAPPNPQGHFGASSALTL